MLPNLHRLALAPSPTNLPVHNDGSATLTPKEHEHFLSVPHAPPNDLIARNRAVRDFEVNMWRNVKDLVAILAYTAVDAKAVVDMVNTRALSIFRVVSHLVPVEEDVAEKVANAVVIVKQLVERNDKSMFMAIEDVEKARLQG